MSDENTRDAAEPSPASAGSVANETAIDSRTLAVKLHAVAAAACYGDQAIRDWLHIAANHIAIHNMGITGCGRWIPVTEKLPDEGVTVLGWDKSNGVVLTINAGVSQISHRIWFGCSPDAGEYEDAKRYSEPTHWMPLPEPPAK